VQCGRLIESWRQTRCRVKMFKRRGTSRSGGCVRRRPRRGSRPHHEGWSRPGRRCRRATPRLRGRCRIYVAAEPTVPVQVAVQPISSLVGIGWWWQASAPALQPVLGGTGRQAPGGLAHQRSQLRWSSGKRRSACQHRQAGRRFQRQGSTVTRGRRQPGTQRIELVVQPLLGHLAVRHQPTAIPNRSTQRRAAVIGWQPWGVMCARRQCMDNDKYP
jgi:hypothetical protein